MMDFGVYKEADTALSLFLENYGMWAVFIGTLFTGEVAILLSITFALSGLFGFTEVILVTLLATFCADFFWFLIGRWFSPLFVNMPLVRKLLVFSDSKDQKFISRYAPNVLLISRFAYGLRLVITVWLAMIGTSIRRFVIMNTFGTFIYILILCGLGVATHKGIEAITFIQNPWVSFSVALALTVGISVIVRRRFTLVNQLKEPALSVEQVSEAA